MTLPLPQNPGIGGLDELTTAEELFVQNLAGLSYVQGDILYYDGSDLNNLGAGTNGQFLKTQGVGANPIWTTLAAGGDVNGPASATDNAIVRFDGTTGKLIKESTSVNASEISIATGGGSPTIDQVQEYFDNTGSSGFFEGGAISDGGSGTVDVAAGSGFIRTTNDSNAELQSFKWGASAGIAVTDNTTQYIYVDDTGTISLSTDEFLETPDKIQIGVVTDEGGVIVNTFNLGVRLDESIGQAGRFMRRIHGITRDKRKGGLIFGQSGDANRDVTVTAGVLWWGRTEYPISSFDTSGADTFETYSAGGQEDAVASQFPNTQYDSSGTLTTMTNNRWANLFFFLIPDDTVVMVYGRSEFVSEAGADTEGVPSSSLPTKISETSILAARFTFQKSANTATISSAFDTLFANASVTDHANLATLAWTSAGHTGTATTVAGFEGAGAAAEYTLSGTGTELALTTAPTFTGDVVIANGNGLIIGNATQITADATMELQVLGTSGNDSGMILGRFDNSAFQPQLEFVKSRSATIGGNAIVQNNDALGGLHWHPDDGVDYSTSVARFIAQVDDASPAENDIGAEFVWSLMPGDGGAIRTVMKIEADGTLFVQFGDISVITGGVDIAASKTYSVSGTAILSDSAGTMTLSNVDALDATTATTIATGADNATKTTTGVIEIATVAETNTGTDDTRAVSPDGLDGWDGSAQILAVGALNSGSITADFGNINNGTHTITTTGIASLGNIILGTDGTASTLTLTEKASIALDPAGGADGDYSGTTVTGTGGATIAFGEPVYLAVADSRWELTDASAVATAGIPLVGIAVTSSTDGNPITVLLHGIIRADAVFPTFTVGAQVFLSETAGDLTQTAPTTADAVVKAVGFATTANEVYWNPNSSHITVTG